MKQLGNLAVICAQRPELLLQLRDGLVSVQAKNRAAMEAVTKHKLPYIFFVSST